MNTLNTAVPLKTLFYILLLPLVLMSTAFALPQGDFDGNGHEDIVFWNPETNEAIVYLMNGAERMGTLHLYANGPSLFSQILSIGDLDGDETPDFVWNNEGENDLFSGTFSEELSTSKIAQSDVPDNMLSLLTALQPGSSKVLSRAYALDGDIDFEYDSYYSIQPQLESRSPLYVYTKVTSPLSIAGVYLAQFAVEEKVFQLAGGLIRIAGLPDGNFDPVEFGDFNNDGYQDILWQNASNGHLLIWSMKDGQLMDSRSVEFSPFGLGWPIAAAIDVNGDGVDELILSDAKSDRLAYWPIGGGEPVLLPMESPGGDWVLVPSLWRRTLSQVREYRAYH